MIVDLSLQIIHCLNVQKINILGNWAGSEAVKATINHYIYIYIYIYIYYYIYIDSTQNCKLLLPQSVIGKFLSQAK